MGTGTTFDPHPRPLPEKSERYPRCAAAAQVGKEDISASQYAYHDRGHVHEFQLRAATFYQTEQWHRTPDLSKAAHEDPTPFRRVPIPDDTTLGTFGDQALLELRSSWSPPGAPGGRSVRS